MSETTNPNMNKTVEDELVKEVDSLVVEDKGPDENIYNKLVEEVDSLVVEDKGPDENIYNKLVEEVDKLIVEDHGVDYSKQDISEGEYEAYFVTACRNIGYNYYEDDGEFHLDSVYLNSEEESLVEKLENEIKEMIVTDKGEGVTMDDISAEEMDTYFMKACDKLDIDLGEETENAEAN